MPRTFALVEGDLIRDTGWRLRGSLEFQGIIIQSGNATDRAVKLRRLAAFRLLDTIGKQADERNVFDSTLLGTLGK
jgi:hypothetical protein